MIKKSNFAADETPIMQIAFAIVPHHTRAYLHYLFKQQSSLYCQLAAIHNVAVMQAVCRAMQACVLLNSKK